MVDPGFPKRSKRDRDRQTCRDYLSKDEHIDIKKPCTPGTFRPPCVFTSVVRRMSGYNTQSRATTRSPLKHGGFTQYTLYRRQIGLQSRSRRVRKISPLPTGSRSQDRPARRKELCRLCYPGLGIIIIIIIIIIKDAK